MSNVKITGLDDTLRALDRLGQKAKALDGTHNVPMKELLTASFLRLHTAGKCVSLAEWLGRSPFKIETQAEFDAIPSEQWDDYVKASTDCATMRELLMAAGAQYVKRRLFQE